MTSLGGETHCRDSKKCVSVGLLVNDFSGHLKKSISSILDQDECLEIFVLFPTKISEKEIIQYSSNFQDLRINFLHDKNNNIIGFANETASSFKGEYFLFLKENEIATPYSLHVSLHHLKQTPQYVLAHGFADKIEDGFGNRQSFKSLTQKDSFSKFSDGSSMALATILIKRSAWIILGGFDESLPFCFELDFAIRACKAFSDRILFIDRIQADTTFKLAENIPVESLLGRIFESFYTLKKHNLNAESFLRKALSDCIARLTSLDKLKLFSDCVQMHLNQYNKYLDNDVKNAITKTMPIDRASLDSIALLEPEGQIHYREDGLAARLISCISLEMYSGYFANAKGPYATYTEIRNNYHESIEHVKYLEKFSLIAKGRKISGGFRDKPFGVNLIGHAFDVFGLGEALRMVARALIAAEVPLNVIDVPARNGCTRENNFLENYIESDFSGLAPYAFNVICMSPSSHAKWLLDEGLDLSLGRYSISAWFWETSTWPSPWENLLQFIDSAWAFSSIIHEALLPHCKKNKVILEKARFPAEIYPEDLAPEGNSSYHCRSKFNLPDDKIIFIFSFDPKSQIERKNPIACIRVFNDAFGDKFSQNRRTDVCLVIKTFKPEIETHEWNTLIKLASSDARIILILESLDRSDLLGLYSCCNVFLSLHRTEGYGLGIAEALQLGLKVVVTGYGGNIDFCFSSSVYLIDYKLVPIPRGSYPLSIDHHWAEPDLNQAVQACKKVVIDLRNNPSNLVDKKFNELFSASTSGQIYRQSLESAYHKAH